MTSSGQSESRQRRMWAYLPLPCDLQDVGDLEKWVVIEGDPVSLLEEALPFVGWGSCPDGLKERIEKVLEPLQ